MAVRRVVDLSMALDERTPRFRPGGPAPALRASTGIAADGDGAPASAAAIEGRA